MTVFQSLVLGAVQGLTEFLPISSSGHLILLPRFFDWGMQTLAFDTTLHLGTALALVIYFWKDCILIAKSFFKDISHYGKSIDQFSHDGKMALYILAGSIPAGLLGFFLGGVIEKTLRWGVSVMVFLLLGSILMFIAEIVYLARAGGSDRYKMGQRVNSIYAGSFFRKIQGVVRGQSESTDFAKVSFKSSFIIGLFQALALFPGVSRSGSTISGGMIMGLNREDSARFSFLLSIPIVIGAGVFKVIESFGVLSFDINLFLGFLASFVTGLLAIKFLLEFLRKNSLYVFVIYRLILSLILFNFLIYT